MAGIHAETCVKRSKEVTSLNRTAKTTALLAALIRQHATVHVS